MLRPFALAFVCGPLMALHLAASAAEREQDAAVAPAAQLTWIDEETAKPAAEVFRDFDDLKARGDLLAAGKKLKLANVDFNRQMVIAIAAGRTNAFGVRLKIERIEKSDDGKTATVHWKYYPYLGGAAPPDRPGNPSLLAVVDRFEGKVQFEKSVYRLPVGTPLPPSAPPGGGGRPRLPQLPR